jgi:ABC-type transport system involved in multi-copper enzyme maturation permease subunit
VVAISGGLAYVLLIESILTQVLGLFDGPISQINAFLPGSMAKSLMSLNQAPGGVVPGYLIPMNATLGIGIWILLFLGLSLFIFRRQDLSE